MKKSNCSIILLVFCFVISVSGFSEESGNSLKIDAVRITVKEGNVLDEKSGRTLTAGDRLVIHADGSTEFSNLKITPSPMESNPPAGNLIAMDTSSQKDSSSTDQTVKQDLSIKGEVVDEKGQPVTDAKVTINGNADGVSMTGNQFSIASLQAGEYQLSVTHPTLLGVTKKVQAGETVTLQLHEKAQVIVTVQTKRGEPLAGALIDFLSAKDQRFIKAIREKTDAEGPCRVQSSSAWPLYLGCRTRVVYFQQPHSCSSG